MALLVAILLAVFVLCEAAARVWLKFLADPFEFYEYTNLPQKASRALEQNQFLAFHPLLVKAPKPGYECGANRVNAHGFRGGEIVMPKPTGEYRLACLGGSTTMDEEIDDWRETYPAVLEHELQERGYRVTVINAGVSGHASYEVLINYALRVSYMDVDMIVLYEGINDWMRRLAWPPDQYTGDLSGNYSLVSYLAGSRPFLNAAGSSVFLRVALAQVGYHFPDYHVGLDEVFFPGNLFSEYFLQVFKGEYPSGIFAEVSVMEILRRNPPTYYEHNLGCLIALARHFGADVTISTVTWSPEWNVENKPAAEGFVYGLQEMNTVTKRMGAEYGVPVLDLENSMPSDPELWEDVIHNNARGARVKASMYADFIVENGLIGDQYRTVEKGERAQSP